MNKNIIQQNDVTKCDAIASMPYSLVDCYVYLLSFVNHRSWQKCEWDVFALCMLLHFQLPISLRFSGNWSIQTLSWILLTNFCCLWSLATPTSGSGFSSWVSLSYCHLVDCHFFFALWLIVKFFPHSHQSMISVKMDSKLFLVIWWYKIIHQQPWFPNHASPCQSCFLNHQTFVMHW